MGDDIDLHLGKRLRRRRRLLGLTQQQVAEGVGIRFQQIQKYECGANRISAARLWQLAQVLDVPVNYFYDGLTERPCAASATAWERAGRLNAATCGWQGDPGPHPRLPEARRTAAARLLDLARSLNTDAQA